MLLARSFDMSVRKIRFNNCEHIHNTYDLLSVPPPPSPPPSGFELYIILTCLSLCVPEVEVLDEVADRICPGMVGSQSLEKQEKAQRVRKKGSESGQYKHEWLRVWKI